MVPAFGMVILPQNLSNGNGQVPGCSCILSVVSEGGEVIKLRIEGSLTIPEPGIKRV